MMSNICCEGVERVAKDNNVVTKTTLFDERHPKLNPRKTFISRKLACCILHCMTFKISPICLILSFSFFSLKIFFFYVVCNEKFHFLSFHSLALNHKFQVLSFHPFTKWILLFSNGNDGEIHKNPPQD